MTKLLLFGAFFLGSAALAGGVLHIVETDETGEVVFAPRVDARALGWWVERAGTIAEHASTLDESPSHSVR